MESTLFPIGMEKHIIFCVVAALFFIIQFVRTKQWYQLVMAAAIPLSLLIYIDEENTALFYGVGILEAVLLCGALVLSIVQARKQRKAEENADDAAKAAAETAEENAVEAAAETAAEKAEEERREPPTVKRTTLEGSSAEELLSQLGGIDWDSIAAVRF